MRGIKKELNRHSDFAGAIMTTDTVKKEICVEHGGFKIAGAAKGSGMIEPNMATMLAFLITDAKISFQQLDSSLKSSVDKTFNMTSVDTDTSTSDMVVLMSNGKVKNVDINKFARALDFVCLELTKMIAKDGEGATKLIICDTVGAKTKLDAKKIAKLVINSPLVKTAVYGHDPNWGRIMMAIGKSDAGSVIEEKIDICINEKSIVKSGEAAEKYDNQKLSDLFKDNDEITIKVDLNLGPHKATAYGCDLSEEYIKINAEYTT
jgi:glutamate N-acetyltransferase/amino-acid N-acetyltransferase